MQATVVTVLRVNYTVSVAAGRRLDSFLLCGYFDVLSNMIRTETLVILLYSFLSAA